MMLRGALIVTKWHQRFTPWIGKHLHLSPEVSLGLPKITIIGQVHIYIENHQGLKGFTETELHLASQNGSICIKGFDFVLKLMLPEEILLEGTIEKVLFMPK